MKKIFVLLLMIPSLGWALTFKSDGTVVDKQGNLLSQKEVNPNEDDVSYMGDINKYNYSLMIQDYFYLLGNEEGQHFYL